MSQIGIIANTLSQQYDKLAEENEELKEQVRELKKELAEGPRSTAIPSDSGSRTIDFKGGYTNIKFVSHIK